MNKENNLTQSYKKKASRSGCYRDPNVELAKKDKNAFINAFKDFFKKGVKISGQMGNPTWKLKL